MIKKQGIFLPLGKGKGSVLFLCGKKKNEKEAASVPLDHRKLIPAAFPDGAAHTECAPRQSPREDCCASFSHARTAFDETSYFGKIIEDFLKIKNRQIMLRVLKDSFN